MSAATADTTAAPMVGARNRTPGQVDAQAFPAPHRSCPYIDAKVLSPHARGQEGQGRGSDHPGDAGGRRCRCRFAVPVPKGR
ncbi:unnamed protein product, partial [Ectocarpus sp. 8 AP-2014]